MLLKMFFCLTWKLSDFVKSGLPEAQNLRICIIFRDLAFGKGPGPWRGALEPRIDVSRPKNKTCLIICWA